MAERSCRLSVKQLVLLSVSPPYNYSPPHDDQIEAVHFCGSAMLSNRTSMALKHRDDGLSDNFVEYLLGVEGVRSVAPFFFLKNGKPLSLSFL